MAAPATCPVALRARICRCRVSQGEASGDHDQIGFVVDDFDGEVGDLRRRGVVFEEFPGYTFVDGVAVEGAWRAVWFRDPDGNLLNVRTRARRGG